MQRRFANIRMELRDEVGRMGFRKEFIYHNALRLKKLIERLEWKRSESEWSAYGDTPGYTETDRANKRKFVGSALCSQKWHLVWDLGCNTGEYTFIARENAEYVLAMDSDHLAVDRLFRSLKRKKSNNVLPLVMDMLDMSPGIGWRGTERMSLLDRGAPDLVLCLALLHHLVISGNIPLQELISWLSELDTSLVIEFISKEDPMVQRLLQNRGDHHPEYNQEVFEMLLKRDFHVQEKEVSGTGFRTLYYAHPKRGN